MNQNAENKSVPTGREQFRPISKFRMVTIGSVVSAAILIGFDYRLAFLVLGIYAFLVLVAPYWFRLGFFLPIIYRNPSTAFQISLTFDDGPDPDVTIPLLDLLARYHISATFFVIGDQVKKHPQLIRRMVEEGHEIGNHSQHHDVILMLKSSSTIYREINDCRLQLKKLGIDSYVFRPPVGVTNPKLFPILLSLGQYAVGFSCRPRDFGNRRISLLSRKVLKRLKPGDIVLLHDKCPGVSFDLSAWLAEVEVILQGIQQKRMAVIPLSQLIGRPVTRLVNPADYVPESGNRRVLDYISEFDRYLFRKPSIDTSQMLPERFWTHVDARSVVLELSSFKGRVYQPVSARVHQLTIETDSQEKLEWFQRQLSGSTGQQITVKLADNNGSRSDASYDVIYTVSNLLFESQPDKLFSSVFQRLNSGGDFYALFVEKSCSGRYFALKVALQTGLKICLLPPQQVLQGLEKAGFNQVQITPVSTNLHTGLLVVSATR